VKNSQVVDLESGNGRQRQPSLPGIGCARSGYRLFATHGAGLTVCYFGLAGILIDGCTLATMAPTPKAKITWFAPAVVHESENPPWDGGFLLGKWGDRDRALHG
jgi:hypothetical protein